MKSGHFLFFLFWLCPHHAQVNRPGIGPTHSCNQSESSGSAGSLTHQATREVCFFSFFYLFRATDVAYGGSQARNQIEVVAAGLHRSSQQRLIFNPLSEARD